MEDYPGMFVNGTGNNSLQSEFAPYALEEKQGGFNKLNMMVTKRAPYIAKTEGTRSFPRRAVIISNNNAELLNNDMVQKRAAPSRIADVSWIKPGKVTWNWWNDITCFGLEYVNYQ